MLLCDRGDRYYQEKNYYQSIISYEKAYYKINHFVNSNTYINFIIMLNIIWISLKDRKWFKKKEEIYVKLYFHFAYRKEQSMTILLLSELIKIFSQRGLGHETDLFYEEIFHIIGKNEDDLKVLANGFQALVNYYNLVKTQNKKHLAFGIYKKANLMYNKLIRMNLCSEKMKQELNGLFPSSHYNSIMN